jgi:uncharacterized protein (DUF1697 family)
MPRYVALLRAINTGRRRVQMSGLRALFEELEVTNVETFIASGNVIFDAATRGRTTLERRIEAHLHAGLGYEVDTFLRTIPELTKVAALAPFDSAELAEEGNRVLVSFAGAPPSAAARHEIAALASEIDEFRVDGREIYWLRRRGRGETKLTGASIERAIGQPATARGAPTVQRLAAKYA